MTIDFRCIQARLTHRFNKYLNASFFYPMAIHPEGYNYSWT